MSQIYKALFLFLFWSQFTISLFDITVIIYILYNDHDRALCVVGGHFWFYQKVFLFHLVGKYRFKSGFKTDEKCIWREMFFFFFLN